jgi:hypothetical protein
MVSTGVDHGCTGGAAGLRTYRRSPLIGKSPADSARFPNDYAPLARRPASRNPVSRA